MTQPDWDDDRLAAAFHARFDRPAPATLGRSVHGAIAGTSPARVRAFGGFPIRNLASAAVVVLLVGSVAVALGGIGRLGGSPSLPSGETASPTGGPGEPPASILGLDVISVSEALAIRDGDAVDEEVAVRGWFTPPRLISCGPAPTAEPVSPVQLHCPDEITWLTEDAESLVHVSGNRTDGGSPQSPALNPDLDGLDSSWWPDLPIPGVDGGSTPAHVVFVGHFDDRRSLLCPSAEQMACRDRFVVDRVAWVDGSEPPPSAVDLLDGAVARSSIEEIREIVRGEAPDSPVLSIVKVDGALGLHKVEPALGTGRRGLIDKPVLWVVRVLESERLVTYIVVDGTDAIYEMTHEGEAVLVGGTEGRTYELECGNLSPDVCETQAAAIVATNLEREPPRRVLSIRFSTGPCGGHTVTFDDGTIEAAMIDCVIPSPVATSPAYELDCGPLDPGTCETRAAEIVAANLKRDPPKRVVSLTITSRCGSYSAIFDDGTGSSADIECILP